MKHLALTTLTIAAFTIALLFIAASVFTARNTIALSTQQKSVEESTSLMKDQNVPVSSGYQKIDIQPGAGNRIPANIFTSPDELQETDQGIARAITSDTSTQSDAVNDESQAKAYASATPSVKDQNAVPGRSSAARTLKSQPAEILPTAVPAPAQVDAAIKSSFISTVKSAPAFDSPLLDEFVATVKNGQAGQVAGVFVPGVLALPVVQQPEGQNNFVSNQDGVITQFSAPNVYGAIGLLAHNFLSGQLFFNLRTGANAVIVYGDGREVLYRIARIQRFQALTPDSPYSNFVDIANPNQKVLTASELFSQVYAHPNQVVFQTCIEANGNSSWGRIFVTAEKVQ